MKSIFKNIEFANFDNDHEIYFIFQIRQKRGVKDLCLIVSYHFLQLFISSTDHYAPETFKCEVKA